MADSQQELVSLEGKSGVEVEVDQSSPSVTRDLTAARKAYKNGDLQASALAHGAGRGGAPRSSAETDPLKSVAPERHKKAGEFIKSIVLGGLDGIITTFAVVSGATGGGLGTEVILVLGFSNILADAMSMGVGDALSTKAENEYILAEKKREEWELEHFPEGEINECVQILVEKGMAQADAEAVIRRYAKYPDLFVEWMMNFELEMQVPDDDENPWKDGFVTFLAFVFFGIFPLLAYAIASAAGSNLEAMELFTISCVISAVMFFILGSLKTHFTKQKWWQGGFEILIMGSSTAAVSYVVGWIVEEALLSSGGSAGQLH